MLKTKSTESKPYQGYLIKRYKVIKPQLDYINGALSSFNKDTKRLFCHILVAGLVSIKRERWVPVSSELIKSEVRDASWEELQDAELIDATSYSIVESLSRRFKVRDEIVDKFVELGDIPHLERIKADKFNLFDGTKSNKKVSNQKHDENGNEEPALITGAMDVIKQGIFNMTAIEAHLRDLKQEADSLLSMYGKDDKSYIKARARHINDDNCFKAILDQEPVQLTEDLWSYAPAYRVQMSGRISHIQGGLQSSSRRMKSAAYLGVDQLRNYDLKSSQVNGLIQQFQLAGLNTEWLESYRDNPNAKKDYAAQVGISVDCWKNCLCAVLFGAWVSKPTAKVKNKLKDLGGTEENKKGKELNSVLAYLFEEAQGDMDKTIEYLMKFTDAIAPLKVELEKWHDWLIKVWALKMGYAAKNGKRYVKNPTGKTLCITDLQKESEWKLKATLAAFVLQGQEAAFIHELTLLSLQYDYQVISNEHDGVVTLGEIPEEAVQKAAEKSGLKYAKLEEKALEGIEDIKRLLELDDDDIEDEDEGSYLDIEI